MTTKTKTKRKPKSIKRTEWHDGIWWCHVDSPEATHGLCGSRVKIDSVALPDDEVPDEITCHECKMLMKKTRGYIKKFPHI